jgi:hypothetical protein
MRKIILFVLIGIIVLTACTSKQASLPVETATVSPTERPTPTLTLAPTMDPSATPPPTVTATIPPTSTAEQSKITLFNTSAIYQTSTQFILEFSVPTGEYYAVARYPGGGPIQYICKFDANQLNHLVCKGATIPFRAGAYTMVYRMGTEELVYSNVLYYQGIVFTPVGISCEVEPQWGYPPFHDFAPPGCYAVTCYLNSVFFWGSNNTCDKKWPFEWLYTYP